jgi:acyl-CoA dehydrogenase
MTKAQTTMETFLYGVLTSVPAGIVIAGMVLLVLILGYRGARLWAWTLAAALVLWALAVQPWLWVVLAVPALVFNLPPLRRFLISEPLMRLIDRQGWLPHISETERIALESGKSWVEKDFFSGKPDLNRMLAETYPQLSEKERQFLEGPTEELCRMVDNWQVHQQKDLSPEAWDYIIEQRFLGMVIPEAYGGLGFSPAGLHAVIAKLSSRSIPLAVDVMVPNSLGPAELLINYGTREQKDHYLPRLARGRDIPCFALTEPEAGSDASSIDSHAEVFRGEDGEFYLRLNWDKRYITLGAVATVLGLAFRLYDPDNLLGKGTEPGITCGLIPTDTPGVTIDQRHNPLGVPFINSPTTGTDVVVPVSRIIGGPEQAGNGWGMLMETLAAGRGIFIPALTTGGMKLAARVTGDYAVVRRQFGLPIGRFEGVAELMTPIGGLAYLSDALGQYICGAVAEGKPSAVISAVAKVQSSEFNRLVFNNAMDIFGGAGIILGPKNVVGLNYFAVPIAITVEGSNVVTRSLIIFGQGLIRSHPYILEELKALEHKNSMGFDRALWAHLGTFIRNGFRCVLLNLTRGYITGPPVSGQTSGYFRQLELASANFAFMADLALLCLGGGLKKRERISGRFADVLSWLCLGVGALRKYEADGRQKQDLPFVEWGLQYAVWRIHQSFLGIYQNMPVPFIGGLLRTVCAPFSAMVRPPSDRVGHRVAQAMQQPGKGRDRLTRGIFIPTQAGDPLADLERAFQLALKARPLYRRLRQAVKSGDLADLPMEQLIPKAYEMDLIDKNERELLLEADGAGRKAIAVDAFDLTEVPVRLEKRETEGLLASLRR